MKTKNQNVGRLVILVSILLCLAVASTGSFANSRSSTHYKFGVFPFMPMSALIKFFNAVGADFTQRVNKRVIAQSRPTFKQFAHEIEGETYDIIFIQPFDYTLAYEHNYRPLARRVESLDAIIVSKSNSTIHSISDLKGMVLANPPSESAVSIVIKRELDMAKLDTTHDLRMIYTHNHFACIQMVLVNEADACATTSPVLGHWRTSTQSKQRKFRIFHTAASIPHTLYMVHQRVPEKDQAKFKDAILTWNDRIAGKMILSTFSVTSFVDAKDSDYDVIRKNW